MKIPSVCLQGRHRKTKNSPRWSFKYEATLLHGCLWVPSKIALMFTRMFTAMFCMDSSSKFSCPHPWIPFFNYRISPFKPQLPLISLILQLDVCIANRINMIILNSMRLSILSSYLAGYFMIIQLIYIYIIQDHLSEGFLEWGYP